MVQHGHELRELRVNWRIVGAQELQWPLWIGEILISTILSD